MDVTNALGRRGRSSASQLGGGPRAPYDTAGRVACTHSCFLSLAAQAAPLSESCFVGRALDFAISHDFMFVYPAVHFLRHEGQAVAHGVLDAECELVADEDLPTPYTAVALRSLGNDAADTPCWAWGNGSLLERKMNADSMYTVVWETRLTG